MIKTSLGVIAFSAFFIGISCNNSNDDNVQSSTELNPKESLKNAIREFPDSSMLVQNLIEIYSDEGDYDSALSLTDQQIKKDSGNAYLWNMKATLLFENEDTLNAIKSLEHAINIYPMPEYLVALGTIYAETKNPKSLMIADGLLKANRVKTGNCFI